jgi:hypothetical protein
MKEVFYVTRIENDGSESFGEGFITYGEAVESIDNLPDGPYQIQKVFVKKS